MSAPQYPYQVAPPPPEANSGLKSALMVGAIVASLAANGFLLYQVHDVSLDAAKTQGVLQAEIDTLKDSSATTTASQRKHLDDLRDELATKAKQLNQAASEAKREAVTYADQKAQALEAEQRQTVDSVNKVTGDVADVRKSADSANARIADVNTDVTGVKTDLASTKTDLQQTRSDLLRVRGDLSSTSSLVATNGSQIDELIRRGERNIVKFTINKKTHKGFQKVGDISIQLKSANTGKNTFTIDVNADDHVTPKKDKSINEPVQFYVSSSLYELVVNSVAKDSITGYLSMPKYQARK